MRPIQKKHPPNSLSQYKRDPNASYKNLPSNTKEELRQSLLEEQGGLCCYCMSRIVKEGSRIEHWHDQESHPKEQLEYKNMLLACDGDEKSSSESNHCDVKKHNSVLKYNPSAQNHARQMKISYRLDGIINSEDDEFAGQLNDILNLNFVRLVSNRKAVLSGFLAFIKKMNEKEKKNVLSNSGIKRQIKNWNGRDEKGQLQPYCDVIIYWLQRWQKQQRH